MVTDLEDLGRLKSKPTNKLTKTAESCPCSPTETQGASGGENAAGAESRRVG